MSIDWITVAAQIANFLVLVWLLKRFLYQPILDGIDAREAEITNRMEAAVRAKHGAFVAESEYHNKVHALDLEQSDMANSIRKEAEAQRDALLAQAHQRMEQEQLGWQTHLDEETVKYTSKMHRAGANALLSLVRKALVDLADETLEALMGHHLIQQVKPMSSDLKGAAGEAHLGAFSSRGALSSSTQEGLVRELETVFPDAKVSFEVDGDQSPGLVLRMGGAQVAWTVDSYLTGLEHLIGQRLADGAELKVRPHEQ